MVIRRARRGELEHLASETAANDGWGVLDAEAQALMIAQKPPDRDTRKRRSRVQRFAWAADHVGPDSAQARRAAAALTD